MYLTNGLISEGALWVNKAHWSIFQAISPDQKGVKFRWLGKRKGKYQALTVAICCNGKALELEAGCVNDTFLYLSGAIHLIAGAWKVRYYGTIYWYCLQVICDAKQCLDAMAFRVRGTYESSSWWCITRVFSTNMYNTIWVNQMEKKIMHRIHNNRVVPYRMKYEWNLI